MPTYALITELLKSLHEQRNSPEKYHREYLAIIESQHEVLAKFQPAFESSQLNVLSEIVFRNFLDFKHNKHWTGLQRSTTHVCDDMPKLRTGLNYLFDESMPVAERIDNLTRDKELGIAGIDVGILTALLLVRFPSKYGVWNGKSKAAMKTLGIWPKFARGTTTGKKYAVINDIYHRLSSASSLDLWSLDGIWHVVNERSRMAAELDASEQEVEVREIRDGKPSVSVGIVYERSGRARSECLRHHEPICAVCGFSFFDFYGELGLNFIHVHHRLDIATRGEAVVVPADDLVPVCPNCHAMLHRHIKPARSVEELKEIIVRTRQLKSPDAGG